MILQNTWLSWVRREEGMLGRDGEKKWNLKNLFVPVAAESPRRETPRGPKPKNMALENSAIKLYPNPASTQIIIEYQSVFDGQFVLFNSLGEMVLKTTLSKEMTKTQLTIKDIANGLYHYEINFADKEKIIGKLSILK